MKANRKIIFLVLMSLFSWSAFAGLLVEPLVGVNKIDSYNLSQGKNYSSENYGYGYGGRLGWQRGGFQIGGDYLYSSTDMQSKDFKRQVNTNEYGAFLGYELPAFFRFYGAYILSADGTTNINNAKINMKDGTGWKLGVGFTLIPFIDINLDYRDISFNKQDVKAWMLGLSLPLDLF